MQVIENPACLCFRCREVCGVVSVIEHISVPAITCRGGYRGTATFKEILTVFLTGSGKNAVALR